MPGSLAHRARRDGLEVGSRSVPSSFSRVLKLALSVTSSPGALFERPSDSPHAHVSGHDADRLLIVGEGAALGYGVATHGLALPGALARAVAARTKRGCEVDLVADASTDAARKVQALRASELSRYDGIIVVLGLHAAVSLAPARSWLRGIAALLTFLVDAAPVGAEIVVVGIQPAHHSPRIGAVLGAAADRHARVLNEELAALCADTPHVNFLELPPGPKRTARHPTAAHYTSWGGAIADRLDPLLAAQYIVDGDRRHRDLRRLLPAELTVAGVGHRPGGTDLFADENEPQRRILALAQSAFRVESALFTVVDNERQRTLSLTGTELIEDHAINLFDSELMRDGVLLVRDTLDDDRFCTHPLVVGGPRIRFFAGFPIESPDGSQIGAFCVFDSHPRRRTDDIDRESLGELAAAAQLVFASFLHDAADISGGPDANS